MHIVSINRILQIRSLINMPPDQQKLAERHALSFIPFCIQTNFLFLSICGECACCKRCDNASYKPIFCGQWLSNFQGGNIGIVPLWDLPTCDKEYKMKEGNLSQGPTCICNILLNSSYNLTINFLFLKKRVNFIKHSKFFEWKTNLNIQFFLASRLNGRLKSQIWKYC